VRLILRYLQKVEREGEAREKAALYDKLGDICCAVKAYPPAIKFYGKQVSTTVTFSVLSKKLWFN
jgi:hypothetical protein